MFDDLPEILIFVHVKKLLGILEILLHILVEIAIFVVSVVVVLPFLDNASPVAKFETTIELRAAVNQAKYGQ